MRDAIAPALYTVRNAALLVGAMVLSVECATRATHYYIQHGTIQARYVILCLLLVITGTLISGALGRRAHALYRAIRH